MTVTDYIAQHYDTGRGIHDCRTIRRKAVAQLAIFGAAKKVDGEFTPLSTCIMALVQDVRQHCGPCTRAQVVAAVHSVGDARELSEYRQRRERG